VRHAPAILLLVVLPLCGCQGLRETLSRPMPPTNTGPVVEVLPDGSTVTVDRAPSDGTVGGTLIDIVGGVIGLVTGNPAVANAVAIGGKVLLDKATGKDS